MFYNFLFSIFYFQISKNDSLPKKICDGCLYKLDICYQFHNTSVKAEKQLLTWLTDLNIKEKTLQPSDSKVLLKEETVEIPVDDAISTDAQSYILQQQQLPYENIEFIEQSDYDGVQAEVRLLQKKIRLLQNSNFYLFPIGQYQQ